MADQHLRLIISGNATGAEKAIRQFDRQMTAMSRKLDRAGRALTMGMTLPLAAAGAAAVKMAMDAQESENLFKVAMGNASKDARQWSESMSDALGLNAYEVRKNVGTFNQMLKSLGLGSKQSVEMAKGLTQLSADMASFYNLKPEEAFQKLQAGISGEIEPLKRLGVVVNEATVKQFAYKTGIAAVGSELSEQQKVQARYGVIMQQTANAQGDLARTQDSATNQMRRLQAETAETAIKFGEVLLPILQDVVGAGNAVVGWLDDMSEGQRKATVYAGLFAASMGPAVSQMAKLVDMYRAVIVWSAKRRTAAVKDAAVEVAAADSVAAAWSRAAIASKAAAFAKLAGTIGLVVGGTVALANTIKPGGAIDDWIKADNKRLSRPLDEMRKSAVLAKASLDELGKQSVGLHQNIQPLAASVTKTTDGFKSLHSNIRNTGTAMAGQAGAQAQYKALVEDTAEATNNLVRAMNGQMVAADSLAGKTRSYEEAQIASQQADLDVKAAKDGLNEAIKTHGKNSDEARSAALNLRTAELRAKDAMVDYKKAAKDKTVAEKLQAWRDLWSQIADASLRARDAARQAGASIPAAATAARSAGLDAAYANQKALGGVISAKYGGRVVRVGEAGTDEAIIPLKRTQRSMGLLAQTMQRMGVGGGGGVVNNFNISGSRYDADFIQIAVDQALYKRLNS